MDESSRPSLPTRLWLPLSGRIGLVSLLGANVVGIESVRWMMAGLALGLFAWAASDLIKRRRIAPGPDE